MTTFIVLLLLSIAIAVAIWMFNVWQEWAQEWLPDQLKRAKVALVEKTLLIDVPFRIVGRPDRVYLLPSGKYVPVEYKNRDLSRVFETDIAQLSLQAWLLRQKGFPTTAYGYVAINNRRARQRTAHRVTLLNDLACEQMIQRYLDVIEGRTQPTKNLGKKCNSCGHRKHCHV